MATLSPAELFARENRVYSRTNIVLCLSIVVGFALFDLIAGVDPRALPLIVHVHALMMVTWLALFAVQSALGAGRNLPLHRRLGWVGAVLAVGVVVSGMATGYNVIISGRAGPVFDPAYFLALTIVGPAVFAFMFASAIARRKRTDWHRRLMLGALVVILEPLLGRLSMIGIMIAQGGPEVAIAFLGERLWLLPLVEFVVHLAIAGILVARDRTLRGAVHPAMWWIVGAVVALYAGTAGLGLFPPFAAWTAGLLPVAAA